MAISSDDFQFLRDFLYKESGLAISEDKMYLINHIKLLSLKTRTDDLSA